MNRIFFLVFLLFSFLNSFNQIYEKKYTDKLTEVFQYITTKYVDTVDQKKITRIAIENILESLDPHSVYIPKDKVKEAEEPLIGNFDGIGIQFNILKDTIIVISPISGGPSEKLGILSGDRIIYIEDELVAGIDITNKGVQKRLKGPKGTIVNIKILRRGISELIPFEIVRDKIPIHSVDAEYMIDNHTGYIKLNKFSGNTIEEFENAVFNLKEQGMTDLILDLSNNGGGYLQASLFLSDHFLSNDNLMLTIKGKSGPPENFNSNMHFFMPEPWRSKPFNAFENGRLIIMIDEGSASASEIVSGAVQDNDRGVIIGRRSFGKGMVQKPIYLSDSSMVRLTIKRFYTPSGRCIQKPYDEGVEKYYGEVYKRYENGELINKDSIIFPDSLKYKTSNKREVYGGGGIMPDIFVPLDTNWTSDLYVNIARKGHQNTFCLNYVNKNRSLLNKNYANVSEFNNGFDIKTEVEEDFIKFIKKEKIDYKPEEYIRSQRVINEQLKALIARNLWGTNAYFYIINNINSMYHKAIEVISSERYKKILDN